jgi:hypothetical protein
MASSIETAFQLSYHNEFEIKFQQKGSRLRNHVTVRPQQTKRDFHDRIGTVAAFSEKTTRHAPTVLEELEHTRISVSMRDYRNAIPFDNEDKLRMNLNDPRMAYAENQAMALGRQLDTVIIAAATGTTYTGEDGTTAETYSASTYGVAVNAVAPGQVAADSNLTIEKLIQARSKLTTAEAITDGEPLVCIVAQSQLDSLLRIAEIQNIDTNAVRALVAGTVDTYMGFHFVRTQLLAKDASNVRTCLVFPKSAIIVGMADERTTKIDQRADLNYTWQVWTQGTFGAARTWREKVVSIACDEDIA